MLRQRHSSEGSDLGLAIAPSPPVPRALKMVPEFGGGDPVEECMKHILSLCLAVLLAAFVWPALAADTMADAQLAISELKDDAKFFGVTPEGHIYHKESGLICSTKIGQSDRVKLVVVEAGKANDVRCDYLMRGFGRFTIQVTKLPPGMPSTSLMSIVTQSATDGLKDVKPISRPVPESLKDPTSGQEYLPLTQAFTYTYHMQITQMKVWLGDVNGWAVKSIASYENVANSPGEGWGRSLWIGAAGNLQRKTQ